MNTLHFTKNSFMHWAFEKDKFYHKWWIHLGKKCINLQYGFCKNIGLSLTREERDLHLHMGIWFFSAWLTIEGFFEYFHPHGNEKVYEGREISFSFHDNTIWWAIWTDPNSWSNKTPKWRHGNLSFSDLLLGKTVHENKKGKKVKHIKFNWRGTDYIMEHIQESTSTWYRSRFPKPLTLKTWHGWDVSFSHEICNPPMRAGKGTTSYNCDDDGTYGCSFKGDLSIDEILTKYCQMNLDDIVKRGRAKGDDKNHRTGKIIFTDKRSSQFNQSVWLEHKGGDK